jgi:anti-sigma regulatory factor (Ser/Thr protein kinase)
LALEPGRGAPRLAREALRAWLAHDDLRHVEAEVLLVASELVANAVVHAHTALQLSYRAEDGSVQVGVRDADRSDLHLDLSPKPGAPVGRNPRTLVCGGRGLVIVDALADEWGVTETEDGKWVWARWLGRGA